MTRLLLVSSTVGMLALGLAVVGAFADTPAKPAPAPAPKPAARPTVTSLTGLWLIDQKLFDNASERRNPPLTDEAKTVAAAARKAREGKQGDVIGGDEKLCVPSGMPGMMTNEFADEILETPGRVTILNEDNALARTVSLTRKAHNTDQDPGFVGASIGHWEGKTLVIETTNLNDRSSHIPGVPNLKKGAVKITERLHTEQGGKILFNDMTFENPASLTKPWTIRYAYHRGAPDAQMWEYACQVNAPGWSERFENDPEFKGGVAKQ